MGLFSRTLSRLDELKKVLTRDPGSRQFLALADEYRRQGQLKEAIEVLEKGLAQNPAAVAGHVALGRLLHQTGRVDDALASFQAALRLDPQNLVALRQTADLYLAKGDKVEAIKKLKLFRGLSPGDREVNELIGQLGEELGALAAPRPPIRPPSEAFPAAAAAAPWSLPAPPGAAKPQPAVAGSTGVAEAVPLPGHVAESVAPSSAPPEVPPVPAVAAEAAPSGEGAGPEPEARPEPAPFRTEEAPAAGPDLEADAFAEADSTPEDASAGAPAAAGPEVTETLAELLRAQGHLGDAERAYRQLAGAEPDDARSRRLAARADEIAAASGTTPLGRLEAWVGPFSRARGPREPDLLAAVEEAVKRLDASAALVTDFEGVPVVSVGPRAEAEAMENLGAELTAFWKNARRSRTEIGEGALDSLVLSGSGGRAAVQVITPSYALLVKTGRDVPVGRLRFEAARAAGQLRPALL